MGNLTKVEAIKQSLVMWERRAETGSKRTEVDPLCQYDRESDERVPCDGCPVTWGKSKTCNILYKAWWNAQTEEERRVASQPFVKILRKALKGS